MREYKIRYKCGTSPFWYIVSYYAYSKAEALEIMTSPGEVFLMEEYKFIKYIGNNFNGYPTFQVRF